LGATSKNNSETFDDCRTPPLLKHNETALVDSGCTGHFLLSNARCLHKTLTTNPLTVILTNGKTMKSTHTDVLDIPELSKAATAAHIFPENNSLLSVGKLCDEEYSVLFNINAVTILDSTQKILMKGSRDSNTGLWRINLSQNKNRYITAPAKTQIQSVNNAYSLLNTGALVNYLHKAMFSCTKSALIHAVKKGHLATWTGLTDNSINTHLKLTPATAMGHMNQKRQKIRLTKEKIHEYNDEDITPQGSGDKTHLVFAVVLDQGHIYTDLTGTFPTRSSKGNNVLMIWYSYDSNNIKSIAMKSKSGAEWVRAFGIVFDEMMANGFKSKLQTMDNEASAALKKYVTENEMNYQLYPPH
jgi:hypothetical protein